MVTLKRNKETAIVEAFRDGKRIGSIITMGTVMMDKTKEEDQKKKKKEATR